MKFLLALLLSLLLLVNLTHANLAQADDVTPAATPRAYQASIFTLGAHYAAKELCSCLFVVEQNEAFCREWVMRPELGSPGITIDSTAKTVEVRMAGKKRVGKWINERKGCVIERVEE